MLRPRIPSFEEEDKSEEIFPKEDERLEFKKPEMLLGHPYVLYYDFETHSEAMRPEDKFKGHSTEYRCKYTPASFSLVLVEQGLHGPQIFKTFFYDGAEIIQTFWETVFSWSRQVVNIIRRTNNLLDPSFEELLRHEEATNCFLCNVAFTQPGDVENKRLSKREARARTKTFHRNHKLGTYEGACCSSCNLKIRYKHELVLICHYASKFDHHLLVSGLNSKLFSKELVQVIPKSGEKFIQISIHANSMYLDKMFNPNLDVPDQHDEEEDTEDLDKNTGELEPTEIEPAGEYKPVKKKAKFELGHRARITLLDSCQFLKGSLDGFLKRWKKKKVPHFPYSNKLFPSLQIKGKNRRKMSSNFYSTN